MNLLRVSLIGLICAFVLPELYFRLLHKSSWQGFQGSWAVVTGSSYGIGRDVAFELAQRGLNVVVHGRSEEKLVKICADIRLNHRVLCRVIVQDVLADPKWENIAEQIKGMDISVLVNNVGGGTPDGLLGNFHTFPAEYHTKILDFNFGSAVAWTHLALPSMIRRGSGRIIMCSSLAYLASLNMSSYGPSKNAIHGLTYVLNNEYDSVVRSETWLIGPVSTPAIGNMEPDGWFVVSSPSFAKRGVELFGFYEEYAPALGHAIQNALMRLLPARLRSISIARASKGVYEQIAKRSATDKKEL